MDRQIRSHFRPGLSLNNHKIGPLKGTFQRNIPLRGPRTLGSMSIESEFNGVPWTNRRVFCLGCLSRIEPFHRLFLIGNKRIRVNLGSISTFDSAPDIDSRLELRYRLSSTRPNCRPKRSVRATTDPVASVREGRFSGAAWRARARRRPVHLAWRPGVSLPGVRGRVRPALPSSRPRPHGPDR